MIPRCQFQVTLPEVACLATFCHRESFQISKNKIMCLLLSALPFICCLPSPRRCRWGVGKRSWHRRRENWVQMSQASERRKISASSIFSLMESTLQKTASGDRWRHALSSESLWRHRAELLTKQVWFWKFTFNLNTFVFSRSSFRLFLVKSEICVKHSLSDYWKSRKSCIF